MKSKLLSKLRVVDFGQGVAGPYCGMLLADFGADVIKVEPPRGDWGRTMGARLSPTDGGTSVAVNRNKRAICLDLGTPDGLQVARDLVAWGNVVIQSFRPGVMKRFGLDAQTLRAARPELIYCSVSGFGDSGPNVDMPAGDSTMQGYAGLMSIIGGPDQEPTRVGVVVGDMLAGMHAFEGVLLAEMGRLQIGEGTTVDVSLLDAMMAFQAIPLCDFLITGEPPVRAGNEHPLLAPSGVMRTADSTMVVTIVQHHWAAFCQTMGMPELVNDPRFRTNQDRLANRAALAAVLAPVFAQRTTASWMDLFRGKDVGSAPINDYRALARDPQVLHNAQLGSTPDPVLGRVPYVGNPIHIAGQEVPYRAAPRLGEHTHSVLAEVLNYAPERIDEMTHRQAVMSSAVSQS